jgi:hypothetical protein
LVVDDGEQVQIIGGTGITVTAAADGLNHDVTIDGHDVFAPDTDPGADHGSYVAGGDGTDGTAIHDDTASEISAVTLKDTPVSADFLLIEDSAAGNAKKRITIGTLPAGSETNTLSTTLTGITDDQFVIGGAGVATYDDVPDCNSAGYALNYDAPTNNVDCVTDLATDTELAAQDACDEITDCTPNAITAGGVTYLNLSNNLDIGFGAAQVPQGSAVAPINNPALTGDPTAPTPSAEDNETCWMKSPTLTRAGKSRVAWKVPSRQTA